MNKMRKKYFTTLSAIFLFISIYLFLNISDIKQFRIQQNKKHAIAIYQEKRLNLMQTKKLFVMGILTRTGNKSRRDLLRKTFIKHTKQLENEIPYRFEYKFCFDQASNESKLEEKMYNDVMYLNCSIGCGYAQRYGFKLQAWIKYVMKHYPDVTLLGRMDDDVFVCVPQLFHYVQKIESPLLYFGWNQTKTAFFDEQFFVLGRKHLERISLRDYCFGAHCNSSVHLLEKTYGTNSFQDWVSIYNDVDIRPDNTRIVHYLWAYFPKDFMGETLKRYVKADFCNYHLTFHKASLITMSKLHQFNARKNVSKINIDKNEEWTGECYRENPYKLTMYNRITTKKFQKITRCKKWIILSSTNISSERIDMIIKNWTNCCIVVLEVVENAVDIPKIVEKSLDQKEIEKWKDQNVHYLNISQQEQLFPLLSDFLPRTSALARQHIGYLYAIEHGADTIIDIFPRLKHDKLIDPGKKLSSLKINYHCPGQISEFDLKNTSILSISNILNLSNAKHLYTIPKQEFHNPNYTNENQITIWCKEMFSGLVLPTSVSYAVSWVWRDIIGDYFQKYYSNISSRVTTDGHDVISLCVNTNRSNFKLENFTDKLKVLELLKERKTEEFVEYLKTYVFCYFLKHSFPFYNIVSLYQEMYMRKFIEIQDFYLASAWDLSLKSIFKTNTE